MDRSPDTSHEYETIRQGAGFLSLPPRSLIEITGADRATFLHNLCTNDIRHCPVGGGRELFVTNVQGKTLGHGFALVRQDSIWLVASPGSAKTLLTHLDRYIIREDVTLLDLSDRYVEWLVCGPQWTTKIPMLTSLAEMWSHAPCELGSCHVRLVRSAWSTDPNFMLIAPQEDESRVTAELEHLGGLRCDGGWFDRLRIAAGFPEFGRDISERNLPQEIDRDEQAISFTKGCYLGQETVARLDALGHVNWRMRGVRAALEVPLTAGLELDVTGTVVARVTSCAASPRNDELFGLALVRSAHATRGTTLNWHGHQITVDDLPLPEA